MEDIALKWYCNKAKFRQVMSMFDTYKEVIGRVCNSTFELEIKIWRSGKWNMYLNRNTSDGRVDFQYRVISYGQILSAGSQTFSSGDNSKKFADFEMEHIIDCNLDLFVVFRCKRESNENLKEEFQIENLQYLSSSLQNMFEKEHMSDIVLKCDSVSLKAHKNILSAQSPVFEAMFKSPMFENNLDIVVIEDINPSVFQVMVSFMYTGKVKVTNEAMTFDLLYAAEKYQIEALKEGCLEYLKSILSLENAVKILEVSGLFDEQLKLHCLRYVKDEFEELKYTKEWVNLKLKNPALALEIYSLDE